MNETTELAERYVAVWNEPDAVARAAAVRELWSPDAAQRLEPPEEMRQRATALGVGVALEVRGHPALEQRVTLSHTEFVQRGGHAFRLKGAAARVGDVVKFAWEMAPRDGGETAGSGVQILVLADDGRIRGDYQFID
jgi:hypothetical protein